jgi:hypothetical protein
MWSIRELAHKIPKVPVVLESQVDATGIENELRMARACFSDDKAFPLSRGSAA